MKKRAAVLALQGDFAEHEKALEKCGVETLQIRQRPDLEKPFDFLILPGGESTVMGKLLRELDLFSPLQERIREGLPTLATCAGLILLAKNIENDPARYFQTLSVTVRRNAYGRQLGSFYVEEKFAGMEKIPMSFIRAPAIVSIGEDVEVLSHYNGVPTAVKEGNMVALAYHPELLDDCRIFEWFLMQKYK